MGDSVYLVHLTGFDDTNFGRPVTVRASSRSYFGSDFDYRARLEDMELLWQMEPGFERIYNNEGVIRLVNNDAGLDRWVNYRFDYCVIRRGDSSLSYSDANFPKVFEGPVFDFQATMTSVSVTVADRLQALNRPITSVELSSAVFDGSGLPGAVCRGWLLYNDASGFSTGFTSADVDRARFDAIDEAYPYDLSVSLHTQETEFNYLDALDNALNGLPFSLFVNRSGLVSVAEFRRPSSVDNATVYYPIAEPEIERIFPVAEVSSQYLQNDDRGVEDAPVAELGAVKSSYPRQWRKLQTGILYPSAGTDTEREDVVRNVVASLLGIFNGVFDRLIFSTRQPVSTLNLGDQVAVEFPRYGYNAPVPGIVTLIRESISGIHELELWTSPPLVQPTGSVIDVAKRPVPDIVTSVDSVAVEEGNVGGIGVRLNVRPSGGREVRVESNNEFISVQPPSLYFTPEAWGREQLVVVSADNSVPSASRSGVVSLTGSGVNEADVSISVGSGTTTSGEVSIIVSRTTMALVEGSSDTFSLRLSANPGQSRVVLLTRINDDILMAPAAITFNSSNWYEPVSVKVSALEDADSLPETGTIKTYLSGVGTFGPEVEVTISDNDSVSPPSVTRTTTTHCVYRRDSSRPDAPSGAAGEDEIPSRWLASAPYVTASGDVWRSCRVQRYEDGTFVSADAWGTPTKYAARNSVPVASVSSFTSDTPVGSSAVIRWTISLSYAAPSGGVTVTHGFGSAFIAAGSRSGSGSRTVTVERRGSNFRLTLHSGPGYTVGSPSSQTITIYAEVGR